MRETRASDALIGDITTRQAERQRSNFFLTLDELRRLAETDTVSAQAFDGGLYIFCRRGNCEDMYYWLEKGTAPVAPVRRDLPLVLTLTQLAAKESSPTQAEWEAAGLAQYLTRMRLVLPQKNMQIDSERALTFAKADQLDALHALMADSFEPLTSAIPSKNELLAYILAQRVLVRMEDGRFLGFIHFEPQGSTCMIWHVAAAERGRGVGTELMRDLTYHQQSAARVLIWVRDDNAAALRLYEKSGFTPDGRIAPVMIL